VHALNLLRLAELTGRVELATRAASTIRSVGAMANRFPAAFSQLLLAVDWLAAGPREIVIAGAAEDERAQAMLQLVRTTFVPQRVVARASPGADPTLVPLVANRASGPKGARAFVCRNYSCLEPADDLDVLRAQLST
jgi:uncharacterized protein YyaL (SSP411 family)